MNATTGSSEITLSPREGGDGDGRPSSDAASAPAVVDWRTLGRPARLMLLLRGGAADALLPERPDPASAQGLANATRRILDYAINVFLPPTLQKTCGLSFDMEVIRRGALSRRWRERLSSASLLQPARIRPFTLLDRGHIQSLRGSGSTSPATSH